MSLFGSSLWQFAEGQAVNSSVYHCSLCNAFYPSNMLHICLNPMTATTPVTAGNSTIDWGALAKMPEKEAVKRFKKYLGERYPKTPPTDPRQLEFCWEGGFDL